ncbi:MAG: hypothetical protein KAW52_00465 [candidate division Zixibacteria bacterium]|nr:hypothetical protein [candidate division Zixibacteria bacterium]
MRKRKKIEDAVNNYPQETIELAKIELLLDIRQLLVEIRNASIPDDIKGFVSVHPPILGTELLEKKRRKK